MAYSILFFIIVVKLTWPRQELDQIIPTDDIESAARLLNMEVNGKMVAPTCHSFLEKKKHKNRDKKSSKLTSLVNIK